LTQDTIEVDGRLSFFHVNDTQVSRIDWIIPCIDCFKRLEAVRADKEECEADNATLTAQTLELFADNKEYREQNDKLKKNRPLLIITGVIAGFVTNLFIK